MTPCDCCVACGPLKVIVMQPKGTHSYSYKVSLLLCICSIHNSYVQQIGSMQQVHRSIPGSQCERQPKWLNIMLNINGVLCQCMEKSTTKKQPRQNEQIFNMFFQTVQTIVGPKRVYTCLGLSTGNGNRGPHTHCYVELYKEIHYRGSC